MDGLLLHLKEIKILGLLKDFFIQDSNVESMPISTRNRILQDQCSGSVNYHRKLVFQTFWREIADYIGKEHLMSVLNWTHVFPFIPTAEVRYYLSDKTIEAQFIRDYSLRYENGYMLAMEIINDKKYQKVWKRAMQFPSHRLNSLKNIERLIEMFEYPSKAKIQMRRIKLENLLAKHAVRNIPELSFRYIQGLECLDPEEVASRIRVKTALVDKGHQVDLACMNQIHDNIVKMVFVGNLTWQFATSNVVYDIYHGRISLPLGEATDPDLHE